MAGYSIHIGLNEVDPAAYAGWHGYLQGCIPDANAMAGIARYKGFEHVGLLLDGDANRGAVMNEVLNVSKVCAPGDFVLLSYSGHGGQVPDLTDEEGDGWDETWCLWDGQFLDDEIGWLLSMFPEDVRVVLFSDSCHSGTISREIPQTFTEADYTLPADALPRALPLPIAQDVFDANAAFYGRVRDGITMRGPVLSKASILCYSACKDHQLSYDGRENGLYTGNVMKVWDGGAFAGNWRQFHRKILERMPSYQTPNFSRGGAHDPRFMQSKVFDPTPV